MKYKVGDKIDPTVWRSADSSPVKIPDPEGRLTLLQFSRWAGCPICNMHLASFKRRATEIEQARIAVVMVFHSPAQDVMELRGDLPFTLVADPDRACLLSRRSQQIAQRQHFWGQSSRLGISAQDTGAIEQKKDLRLPE